MIRIFTRFSLLLFTMLLFGIGTTFAQGSFTMTADTSIATCGATLTDHVGAPVYDDNTNDTTIIRPSTASKLVQLHFNRFNTEANYDFLYIYDGITPSAPLLAKFHGTTVPPDITATNPDGAVTLVWHTDVSVTRAGFEIQLSCVDFAINSFSPRSGMPNDRITVYGANLTSLESITFSNNVVVPASEFLSPSYGSVVVTVPQGAVTGPLTASNGVTAYTTPKKFFVGHQYIMSVDRSVTSCEGLVLSHDVEASATYANDQDYGILLNPGTPGKKTRITFNEFSTENNYDFVYVYDGADRSAPLLGTFMGTAVPPQLTATNAEGQLYVFFHTDISVVREGFNFTIDCVTFGVSDFSPHSGLEGDTVTVRGSGLTAVQSIVFNTSAPVTSFASQTDAEIKVVVPVDATTGKLKISGLGDVVMTSAVFHLGREYYMPSGVVTTCVGTVYDHDPNDGVNYRNNVTSVQTIRPQAAGAMTQLIFTTFRLEQGADFLYVYDGADVNAPLLATLTGTTNPSAVTATNATGALTLKFVSGGFGVDAGFAATIRCTEYGITDFTPKHGVVGDSVTITGNGLDKVTGVHFNFEPALFHLTGTNRIRAAVPPNATTGPLRFTSLLPDTFVTEKIFQVGSFNIIGDVAILTTCDATVLSHEGGGNYPLGVTKTETFVPATPGKALRLTFDTLRIVTGDTLKIYDGTENDALLGVWTGNTSDPEPVMATNIDGKLTVKFKSDATGNNIGFRFKLACTDFVSPTITSVYPAALRKGFPFAVFVANGGGSSVLSIDGTTFTGGSRVGNIIKGNLPATATAGVFTISNRVGSSSTTVNILSGNYCVPFNSACYNGTGEIITEVKMNGTTLDNVSECNNDLLNNTVAFAPVGSATATVYRGSTYLLSVTSQNNHIISVWIDYNQNGTFEAAEYTNITQETGGAGVTADNNVVIPMSARYGTTVMRVRARAANNNNGPNDACVTFASGETEDYTITILDPLSVGVKTIGNVSVYPNPSNGTFSLDLSGLEGKADMRIIDALGRAVHSTSISPDQAVAGASFNVSHLAAGVYTLELNTAAGRNIQRLVIQK